MALQAWADVANIRFQRIGTGDTGAAAYSDGGVLRFANYSEGDEDSAAFTYLPRGEAVDAYQWERVPGVDERACKR